MAREEVRSPLPGIFYRGPNPESDPFAVEGQAVGDEDVIGLIEVMKQFHELRAGVSGKLVEFLVENNSEVTAGQALAVVET